MKSEYFGFLWAFFPQPSKYRIPCRYAGQTQPGSLRAKGRSLSGYLISRNIIAGRIKAIGFGEEMPKYTNDTEEGRARNHRVEFAINANEKMIKNAAE